MAPPTGGALAIYRAGKDGYQDSSVSRDSPIGTPEQALDCACGPYLTQPTA